MKIDIDKFLIIDNKIDRKDFYVKYTTPIGLDTPIDDYYGDVIYSHQLSTINNYMSDNNLHKYMIIDFGDDSVMVCMKLVNMFKYVYLRVQSYPKSLNGNIYNEIDVYNKLCELDAFEKMWISGDEKQNWEYNKRILDTNFFDRIEDRWDDINSTKWLKKRKIKRFLADDMFGLYEATEDDYGSMVNCLDTWCDGKAKLHNIKIINNIKSKYKWLVNNENIKFLLFKYNDIVIGGALYGKFGGNSYQNMFEFSLTTRTNEKDEHSDQRYKTFLQGSAQIMNYYHLKYFKENTDVEFLTYAGALDSKLKKHKQANYSDVIKFYGVDIKNEK